MWFNFTPSFFTTKGTKETKGVTKEFLTYVDFLCVLMCLMWFKFLFSFFTTKETKETKGFTKGKPAYVPYVVQQWFLMRFQPIIAPVDLHFQRNGERNGSHHLLFYHGDHLFQL
jgi:hypothetical protein